MPYREQNSNKGTFGKVLNICGSKNYIGAAYLSTISSLKVGAGFSALASEWNVIKSVSTMLAEAVYLSRKDGLKQLENFTTILIGCGLGTDYFSRRTFLSFIKNYPNLPTVIDADGLNLLAEFYRKNNKLVKIFANKAKPVILTPHPLEAARLLDVSLEDVLNDLEKSAKSLCEKYNCVTVLKTHKTIICSKDNLFVNQHGNSALAKAGSGDVLAGVIAGLLAQNMPPFEAAKLGVYLHSRAGEIASETLTEYSVLASDLPNYLSLAIKEII